jgi:hypothetical protein
MGELRLDLTGAGADSGFPEWLGIELEAFRTTCIMILGMD